ncbi:hypothetical protein N9F50_01950 [Akkermansiaceae bacterium]|nr:hypothetical protein [Akkermansiaceae bacterium]
MKRISIALGYEAGRRAKQKQVSKDYIIDTEFSQGFLLALEGKELPYSPDELREEFLVFFKEITKRDKALAV